MRMLRDFVLPSSAGWSVIPVAFSDDAEVFIWGCFDTDVFDAMARFLISKKTDGFTHADQWWSGTIDRAAVLRVMNRTLDSNNYMQSIAKFTNCDTWGGIPGFGSNNIPYEEVKDVPPTFRTGIKRFNKKRKPRLMHVPVITDQKKFRKLFESAEMGSRKFNAFGYMKYTP